MLTPGRYVNARSSGMESFNIAYTEIALSSGNCMNTGSRLTLSLGQYMLRAEVSQ